MDQSIAEQLREMMTKLNVNQSTFSEMLEVDPAHLSRVINGKAKGSLRLLKYAQAVTAQLIGDQDLSSDQSQALSSDHVLADSPATFAPTQVGPLEVIAECRNIAIRLARLKPDRQEQEIFDQLLAAYMKGRDST